MDKNKAWGFSLFCDDFRQEIGGKVSIMGLYQNDYLFKSALPIVVPRFCIMTMYYELIDAVTSDIEYNVYYPGEDEPGFSTRIERSTLPSSKEALTTALDPGQERLLHTRIPTIVSPFEIRSEGQVKVRVKYDDGAILNLGSLIVRRIRDDEDFMKGAVLRP